ncbi:MAG: EAL domain-containing protein [Actinomycetota bacterium]
MHTDNSNGLSAEVWRTFFDTRALGLIVLAVAVLTPAVPVDPRVALFAVLLGLPATVLLRSRIADIVPRPWIVTIVDAVLICVAISIDPVIAPAGGVLLLASGSITAAAGWRPTVLANLATAPIVFVALARSAPDSTVMILLPYLVCSVGVAIFVSDIASSERDARLDREALIDGLDAVVWEARPYPFVEARFSGRLHDLLGVSPEATAGPGQWLSRLPALDRARVVAESQRLIDTGEDHELSYRVLNSDGDLRHVRDRVRVETGPDGRPVAARGIVVDVTDEVSVRETNRNLAELVERVQVGLLVARRDAVVGPPSYTTVTVNPAYEALSGLPATALINTDVIDPLRGDGREDVAALLDEVATTGTVQRMDEARDLRADGRRVLSLEAFPISENLVGLNVADVTERVTTAETLRYQALHDALTGLPNRALLENRLQHAITSASRDDRSVGLLLLDLNQFKEVNDTLGHDAGDRLLRIVADRLRTSMRAIDTVARLGGDEFAVLLTDDVSPRRTLRAAERAMACFEQPLAIDGMTLQTGASLGVAIAPDHGTDADELRKNADIAMYVAKRRGGGIAVYDPVRDQTDRERLNIVSELRRAIDGDELTLHYQPAVDLASGGIHRVEALVRWEHPDRGLIPPVEFVDLAEVTGLIRPLTQWVIDRAMVDLGALQGAGHELGVSINVSVRNLYEPGFVDSVRLALERHDIDGRYITLELTETQVMDDPMLAHSVLGRLQTFGVRSSVDDFGTGHSSLSNLQSLPVSEVKIDKSFVQDMTENEAAAAIVRSIISLGHNLGLSVVAEGVETNEAMTSLALLDCDRAQGYLFARPLPVGELQRFLEFARHDATR